MIKSISQFFGAFGCIVFAFWVLSWFEIRVNFDSRIIACVCAFVLVLFIKGKKA